MVIPVNPAFPVIAAQGVHGDVGFQTGSIVSARVLKILPDNQVRISIGTIAIDVQTEVPLQAGQTLQLAVSQTADGVRLAMVTPQGAGNAALAGNAGVPLDSVTLAGVPVDLATILASSKIQLTAPEAVAVSAAAQTAATQQAGLSALFANLGAATSLQTLPLPLQQAVAQLLAQRPSLDTNLTGDDVKAAFQQSGLFLEASLASGSAPPSAAMPDLKAALIVFRQMLSTSLDGAAEAGGLPMSAGQTAQTAQPGTSSGGAFSTILAQAAGSLMASPSLVPDAHVLESLQQQVARVASDDSTGLQDTPDILPAASPTSAGLRVANTAAALSLMQEAQQAGHPAAAAAALQVDDQLVLDLLPMPKSLTTPRINITGVAHTDAPPPPIRGALPSAQPAAPSTLSPNMPLASTMRHLLADTDAAIARQTLLQVASLPDRTDTPAARLDATTPRWNFEIPFATPHGTAIAQFEISRDGGNDGEAEAAQKVWRARFSLDVEPAGPVHALVSLQGDKTSVRMWAERPGTAEQLRAGAAQLSQALVRAELKPGDIVIREGAPVQVAPASAGHFLDRAL
jgi:Flagellar hook-length control protein FliK